MLNVYISQIVIFSAKEKKARITKFKSGLNVILGSNDTGKSILIKSIFEVFGASVELDDRWTESASAILLDFEVGDDSYKILKWGKSYGISYNENFEVYTSISKELGVRLSEIFNFGMVWNDKDGDEIIPPPAYYLLPFYLDQDKSWTSNWMSFNRLYLSGIRRDLIDFHIGIKPNEYYKSKVKLNRISIDVKRYEKDIEVLKQLLIDAKNNIKKRTELSLNVFDFEKELNSIIGATEKLYTLQVKVKQQIQEYYSQRILLKDQIEIVSKSLKEIKKDFEFATKKLADEVECPTCGAHYSNKFEDRFAIAQDEYKCYDLLNELNNDLSKLEVRIATKSEIVKGVNSEIKLLEEKLSIVKGNLTLADMIEIEGEKQMKKIFEDKIKLSEIDYNNSVIEQVKLKSIVAKFTNKERKEEILEKFKIRMYDNLAYLNLEPHGKKSESVYSQITGLGSAKPRTSLAYFYAVHSLVKEYSKVAMFPVVIDEPEQQGQDNINMPAILKLLSSKSSSSNQTILGLQNTDGIELLEENVIDRTDTKYSILSSDQFDEASTLITPYIDRILQSRNDELF